MVSSSFFDASYFHDVLIWTISNFIKFTSIKLARKISIKKSPSSLSVSVLCGLAKRQDLNFSFRNNVHLMVFHRKRRSRGKFKMGQHQNH